MPDTKRGKFAAGPINSHKPLNLALQAEPKGKPATLTSKPMMSSCIRQVKPQFTCRGAAKVSPHPEHGYLTWHHTGVNPLGLAHLFPIPWKKPFSAPERGAWTGNGILPFRPSTHCMVWPGRVPPPAFWSPRAKLKKHPFWVCPE